MLVSEFGFELPEELIAQHPPAERGSSRMLRLDRRTGEFEDRWFAELPELLEAGDLLVLNDSRVLPARLFATRAGLRTQKGMAASGLLEVLLTERVGGPGENVWNTLVKPAKKVPLGETLVFAAEPGGDPLLRAEVMATACFGERTLRFEPVENFHGVLEEIGHMPLPPYIRRDKGAADTAEDRERYQTVYSTPFGQGAGRRAQGAGASVEEPAGAGERQVPLHPSEQARRGPRCGDDSERNGDKDDAVAGSAAAPTAGLHFTPQVLERLREREVEIARVTLHVGLGTFQPVRVERTEEIQLHAEPYTLSAEAAGALNRAWGDGRRIVAVGTTTTRTLEHVAREFERRFGPLSQENPLQLEEHSGSTGMFLSPGGDDRFRLVGGLLTNFHLPESTLVMLVSAFAGRENVLKAYAHAVAERYRFFSYGDCMLVL